MHLCQSTSKGILIKPNETLLLCANVPIPRIPGIYYRQKQKTAERAARAELSAPHSFRISFYLRLKICEIPSREDFLSRKYF